MRAAEDCAATSSLSRKRSTDGSLPFLAHGSETSLPVTLAAGVSLLTPNKRMERTGPPMIGWRCNGNRCWPNVSKTRVCDTSLLVSRDGMSKRRQPEPTERVPYLPELVQQHLRVLQDRRIKAFGEPVVDWCKQVMGFHAPVLVAQELGETG